MATSTLTLSVPEDLRQFVESRVDASSGSLNDYFRNLILSDRHRARIEDKLIAALQEEPITISDEVWESGDIFAEAEKLLAQRG